MKNFAIVILLVAMVVGGGLYYQQSRKTSEAAATAASLKQKTEEMEASLTQEREKATKLRDRFQDVQAEANVNASQKAKLEQAVTNQSLATVRTNAKPSDPFRDMMNSPGMQEMVRAQRTTSHSNMIAHTYAKLITDMHLTPEQAVALKDLLLNQKMALLDTAIYGRSDDMDPAQQAEMDKKLKAENDAYEAEIKQLLGDENYALFQASKQTQADRMVLYSLKQLWGSGLTGLSDGQEEQLIEAMTQERQSLKRNADDNPQTRVGGGSPPISAADRLNQHYQEQEQLTKNYLARAQSILSPEQFTGYERFLTNQLAMERTAITRAASHLAPKRSSD